MESVNDLFWPSLIYFALVLLIVGGMLLISHLLGQRHKEKATDTQYEGGIKSTGSGRLRFSSQFYLIAMFFVIFDLEAVFIIAWAVAFKDLGWYGYIGASVFIFILLAVLIYEWRQGALDFAPDGREILKAYRKKILKKS